MVSWGLYCDVAVMLYHRMLNLWHSCFVFTRNAPAKGTGRTWWVRPSRQLPSPDTGCSSPQKCTLGILAGSTPVQRCCAPWPTCKPTTSIRWDREDVAPVIGPCMNGSQVCCVFCVVNHAWMACGAGAAALCRVLGQLVRGPAARRHLEGCVSGPISVQPASLPRTRSMHAAWPAHAVAASEGIAKI